MSGAGAALGVLPFVVAARAAGPSSLRRSALAREALSALPMTLSAGLSYEVSTSAEADRVEFELLWDGDCISLILILPNPKTTPASPEPPESPESPERLS